MTRPPANRRATTLLILLFAVLFGAVTLYVQIGDLGVTYLEEGNQLHRHTLMMQGTAQSPWQYRVLSEYVSEALIQVMKAAEVRYQAASAFILFRFAQLMLILSLAAFYYRRLGLNAYLTLGGMFFLMWAMAHAQYDSDLSFATYSDVIFYLLAALLILGGRYGWMIPLTALAALNRETSGLIPFMLLADRWRDRADARGFRKEMSIAVVAVAVYAAIFVGLRLVIGPREPFIPYGNQPGIEMFVYNIARSITWTRLFVTLGVLPIIALYSIRHWPRTLRTFFWTIVPVWLLVHLFASVLAETRLLLVPHALVFIPGALFGVAGWIDRRTRVRDQGAHCRI